VIVANIGISYWGFCEKAASPGTANTPDGHRYGRPILVDELTSRGHSVYSLQQRREPTPYPGIKYSVGFPDIDILFVEWRFPTYKNSGENPVEPDLDRQTELLNHYHGKIPVIIWDADYKMTEKDELAWPKAIIADPALEPKNLTRDRVRLMFWSDWKEIMAPAVESFEYGYVGNNYEREAMFRKYYSNSSKTLREKGIQTKVHGNWLQVSPEREHPSVLIKEHPHIAFGPRLNFDESMKILNSMVVTTHITKPLYAEKGFVSPRYLENVAYGVPALVPSEFLNPDILGKTWRVDNEQQLIEKVLYIARCSSNTRKLIVDEQRSSLRDSGLFSVENVVSFIEDCVRELTA
jgi:hypothetical protein